MYYSSYVPHILIVKAIKSFFQYSGCHFSNMNQKQGSTICNLTNFLYLIVFIGMFYVNGSNAQTLSGLTSSLPTQQATNSSVVVTVTASPPATNISRYWQIRWQLDGNLSGTVTFDRYNSSTTVTPSLGELPAKLSVSMPMGPNNQFTTSLTLRELQLSDNGKVIRLEGDDGGSGTTTPVPQIFTLMVKDCLSNISSDITVEATSYVYNAQGTFKCSNNGELFYSAGARPSSNDTTCLASATWSGQDNLQCWSAPTNVTLGGNLTVVEGNNLTITCNYVDATPIGSSSIFYVEDAVHTRPKNEALVLLSLQRSDNNKVVSCQAMTPFTEIPTYSNTGRSLNNYTINVQYGPVQLNPPPSCTWAINLINQVCEVQFISNPSSQYVSLTLNGTSIVYNDSNQITSNNENQIFSFRKQTVTTADNGRYVLMVRSSVFQSNVSILFNIIVVDMLPTPPPSAAGSSYLGLIIGVVVAAVIIVILIVAFIIWRKRYAKTTGRLDTAYVSSEPIVQMDVADSEVDMTKKKKKKNYVSTEKEEKINPLYAPSDQPEDIGAAYAEVDVKKKTKNKKKNGVVKEEKVNPLYVPSDQPSEIETAYADVDLKKKKKNGVKTEKEEKINPLYVPSDQPEDIGVAYAEVDVKKKTKNKKKNGAEKEEKINPPSDQPEDIGAAYAEVDIKKKKSGKAKQLNPPSSSRDHVEEAYAAVDKKKKKPKPAVLNQESGVPNETYSEITKDKKPPNQGAGSSTGNETYDSLEHV